MACPILLKAMPFLPFRPCRELLALSLLALLPAVAIPAPLPQRAYIWQRAWTPGLLGALTEGARDFTALDVLSAEIAWKGATPNLHRIAVNWPALHASERPIGLVVRIGRNATAWDGHAAATRMVVDVCGEVMAEARRQGIEPAELQLDFDAATGRLDAYRSLLQTIRREVRPPKLVITTLPDWLRSPAFATLVAETDSYVLQVHSLEKPRTIEDDFALCDPVKAMGWIGQAAQLGRRFRIALPSYGYRLVFDASGKFAALEAEGPSQEWPAGFQRRAVGADTAEIAHCVQLLLASPPRGCEGLAWFRFPTAGDELAWSWPTLRSVMQGRIPLARLVLQATPGATGAHDLILANSGDDAAEPGAFRVRWHEARLLASDALGGWQFERTGPDTLVVRSPQHGSNGSLRPGDALQIGWLRFDRAVELRTEALP
jgi:hypothetical protein